jgi:glutaredoxin 3
MITIYSKTGCEYCTLAKQFLSERLIEYTEIDMTDKDASDLKERTRQKTFPFIFDDEKLIGGYFELLDMYEF